MVSMNNKENEINRKFNLCVYVSDHINKMGNNKNVKEFNKNLELQHHRHEETH